ncbi:hypothetical protein IJX73_03750 [bacterium]|nr:hypothetical protein [bacterium]MBQ9150025.1 hypothetical protein [bacterium]
MGGCLKKILIKILVIAAIIAFFALGGYAFVKGKIKEYQYPPRDAFVQSEKYFADFARVSGDYQLYRSFNFFGYKKVNAKYLPTDQKITIFDLKDEDLLSVSDFYTGKIYEKIVEIINKSKDALITYENFEITKTGFYKAGNKEIPYLTYKANVKNIPFKEVTGTFGAYASQDKNQKTSTKVIFSVVDSKAYNPKVVEEFASALRF